MASTIIGNDSDLKVIAVDNWVAYDLVNRPSAVMGKHMFGGEDLQCHITQLMSTVADDLRAFYKEKNTLVVPTQMHPQLKRPKQICIFTFRCDVARFPGSTVDGTAIYLKDAIWVRRGTPSCTWRRRRYTVMPKGIMASKSSLKDFGQNPVALVGLMQSTVKSPADVQCIDPVIFRDSVVGAKDKYVVV